MREVSSAESSSAMSAAAAASMRVANSASSLASLRASSLASSIATSASCRASKITSVRAFSSAIVASAWAFSLAIWIARAVTTIDGSWLASQAAFAACALAASMLRALAASSSSARAFAASMTLALASSCSASLASQRARASALATGSALVTPLGNSWLVACCAPRDARDGACSAPSRTHADVAGCCAGGTQAAGVDASSSTECSSALAKLSVSREGGEGADMDSLVAAANWSYAACSLARLAMATAPSRCMRAIFNLRIAAYKAVVAW